MHNGSHSITCHLLASLRGKDFGPHYYAVCYSIQPPHRRNQICNGSLPAVGFPISRVLLAQAGCALMIKQVQTCTCLERAAGAACSDIEEAAATAAAWVSERRSYGGLLQRIKINAERSSPRQLWRSVDARLGCGRLPCSDAVGAVSFRVHLVDKVAGVREPTADAVPPSLTAAPPSS